MSLSQAKNDVVTYSQQKHQKEKLTLTSSSPHTTIPQCPINNNSSKTNTSTSPSTSTKITTTTTTSTRLASFSPKPPTATTSPDSQHQIQPASPEAECWSPNRSNTNRTQPNDCHSAILTYQQVRRLHLLMEQRVPIHGRGNFPALQVRLRDLICRVTNKLRANQINIRDIRLNGGAASYVLAPEKAHYNDLDLIFATDLNEESKFDVIRDAVLDCLRELHIEQHSTMSTQQQQQQEKFVINDNNNHDDNNNNDDKNDDNQGEVGVARAATTPTAGGHQMPLLNDCAIKEAYVHKMVKVNDEDRWSLISLGVNQSEAYSQQQQHQQQMQNHYISFQHHQASSAFQVATNGAGEGEGDSHKINDINSVDYDDIMDRTGDKKMEINPFELCNKNQQASSAASTCSSASSATSCSTNSSATCCSAALPSKNNYYQAQQQPSYHQNQSHNHNQQQRQFPNSIELKFVDRMRRKFEFSVDSFQIILDSLMDFYHFAPQTSTTLPIAPLANTTIIGSKITTPQPITTSITTDTKQHHEEIMISAQQSGKLNKNQCYNNHLRSRSSQETELDQHDHWPRISATLNHKKNKNVCKVTQILSDDESAINPFNAKVMEAYHQKTTTLIDDDAISRNQKCATTHHQTTEGSCNRSESSSSGCSSSSSIVSSSSSSLSFEDDEPDEELELVDVDAFSDASSSKSLLSSVSTGSPKGSMVSTNNNLTDGSNDLRNLIKNEKKKDKKQTNACYAINNSPAINKKLMPITGDEDALDGIVDVTIIDEKVDQDYAFDVVDNQRVIEGVEREQVVDQGVVNLDEARDELITTSEQEAAITSPTTIDEENEDEQEEEHEEKEKDMNENTKSISNQARMSCPVISENFYPTVVGRSEYGNFNEALSHLEKKLIATRNPEQIRGGGLLKYCNLLVKNYKPTNLYQIRKLERYMCSRFFIDFCDLNQQQAKLESYLANHFSNDPILKFDYLTILYNVVQRSTVCLMNHELRVTLNMIRDLAYKLNDNQLIRPEQYNSNDHQTAMIMQQQQQIQQQHQQAIEIYNNYQMMQETLQQQQHQQHQQQHQQHQQQQHQQQQHQQQQHQNHQHHNNRHSNQQYNSSHKQQNQKTVFNNNNNNKKRANYNGTARVNCVPDSTARTLIAANNTIPPGQQQTRVNYYEHQRPPVILHSGVYRVKMVIA